MTNAISNPQCPCFLFQCHLFLHWSGVWLSPLMNCPLVQLSFDQLSFDQTTIYQKLASMCSFVQIMLTNLILLMFHFAHAPKLPLNLTTPRLHSPLLLSTHNWRLSSSSYPLLILHHHRAIIITDWNHAVSLAWPSHIKLLGVGTPSQISLDPSDVFINRQCCIMFMQPL